MDEKEKVVQVVQEPELFYSSKVETMFRTYDKAILDCMSDASQGLLVSSGLNSKETDKLINLLNLLNNQHKSVTAFVEKYAQMTEKV